MFYVVYVPAKTGSYSLFCVQQVEAPQISDRTDVLGLYPHGWMHLL